MKSDYCLLDHTLIESLRQIFDVKDLKANRETYYETYNKMLAILELDFNPKVVKPVLKTC